MRSSLAWPDRTFYLENGTLGAASIAPSHLKKKQKQKQWTCDSQMIAHRWFAYVLMHSRHRDLEDKGKVHTDLVKGQNSLLYYMLFL